MKEIGRTLTGGKLVEFTELEWMEFSRAQRAAKGMVFHGYDDIDGRFDAEMKPFFKAMKEFCLARFRLNELRSTVKDLEKSLGK